MVTDLSTLPVRTFTLHPPTHAAGRVLGAHATAEDAARVDAALRVVPRTTDKAIAARLGKTSRTIERHFAHLKASGQIRREGSAKSGRWVVSTG